MNLLLITNPKHLYSFTYLKFNHDFLFNLISIYTLHINLYFINAFFLSLFQQLNVNICFSSVIVFTYAITLVTNIKLRRIT